MSADKRSTHTDALATLGTIIDETGKRDAIHLAVEPVIAGEDLMPGWHVGLAPNGQAYTMGDGMKALGIVDPFLSQRVAKGERFWLIVYPRQITSLRHVWEHPDFPKSESFSLDSITKEESEQWLRDFCEHHDCPSYEIVMEVCTKAIKGEEMLSEGYGSAYDVWDHYLTFRGWDAHCEVPDEFWVHFKNVTGLQPEDRITYFSCTC
jgi:hypothetical protein